MSQEDTLRLAAEIVDKFSGPLRNMTKSVHQFDDLLKGHQVRSNVASKEQASRQKELNAQFVDTGRMVIGTINPAFAAMGLSVGAVAASTGLLIGQLRAAGDGFLKVQGAMRRTGMSNDGLEVWVRTLGKLGIDADEARGQLSSLGDVAARLHRNFSPQIQALESQFTNLSGLITNMSKASGAEASEMFWKYYLSHPAPPDQQRKLLAAVGLSPEIANATSDQIKEMIAKAQASVAAHPPIALETMNKIHEAFEEFDDIVKGFNLDLMNAFGGFGANAVKGFGEILHNEAEDIKYLITKAMEFNGWLDKIGGHGNIIGKIVTDMLHPEAAVKALAEKYPWLKNFSDEKLAFSFSGADLGGAGGDSFKDRWGSSDSEKTLTRGVKQGVIEALREWAVSAEGGSGNFGGGGSNRGGNRRELGHRLGIDQGGSYGRGKENSDVTPSGEPVSGLQQDRARMMKELSNRPGLKERLFGQTYGENSGVKSGATQAVMEEIFNRASQRHQTLAQSLGLDGAGLYEQGWNPHYPSTAMENILGLVGGGSNVALGATDNSSQGLAEREKASGKYKFRRKINGESFFTSEGWGTPGFGKTYPAWAAARGLDPNTGGGRDLLSNANKAGVGGIQKIEGDASVRVAFENMPAGAKAYMQHGGMFKTGTVDWGHAMPASDPGGR